MGARGSKASSQGTAIVQAAMHKDVAAVTRLLEGGSCPPDAVDDESNSAMGAACFSGARNIVERMLEAKANLEHKNKIGTTPLWYEQIPPLLEQRSRGTLTSHIAIACVCITAWRSRFANFVPFCSLTVYPRHRLASGYGHVEIVQLLLHSKADADAPNNTNDSPMLAGSSRGHKNVVQCLLDAKAKVGAANNSGDTPLLVATSGGHVELVPLLLQAGADANAKNEKGVFPLGSAASQGSQEAAEALLAHSADVTACDRNGARPLAVSAFCGNTSVTKLLLAATTTKGADIDHRDSSGASALWLAATAGRIEDLRMLLDAGASRDVANTEGFTALQAAEKNGHAACVALLQA